MKVGDKGGKPHIVRGEVAIPPRHAMRFVGEGLAKGSERDNYVGALFTLYMRGDFDPSDNARFERLIKKEGTPAEQERLANLKK